jgi:hypothetical protein
MLTSLLPNFVVVLYNCTIAATNNPVVDFSLFYPGFMYLKHINL